MRRRSPATDDRLRRAGVLPLGLLLAACAGLPSAAEPEGAAPPASNRPAHPDAPFTRVETAEGFLAEPGDALAYAVHGPFGPDDGCILAVIHRGTRRAFHAVLGCGPDRWQEGPLGAGPWSGEAVEAVVMRDLDGDGYVEAVVIASWTTGIGPEGVVPFLDTTVLRWSGTGLERMPDLEQRLRSLQSVEAVVAALPG